MSWRNINFHPLTMSCRNMKDFPLTMSWRNYKFHFQLTMSWRNMKDFPWPCHEEIINFIFIWPYHEETILSLFSQSWGERFHAHTIRISERRLQEDHLCQYATNSTFTIRIFSVTKGHNHQHFISWLLAFSPFPTFFFKGFFLGVIKIQNCDVKSYGQQKLLNWTFCHLFSIFDNVFYPA